MSEETVVSGWRWIEMFDYSLEFHTDEPLAEQINLLAGLADGRYSPETHWPLFLNILSELSRNPDHPVDRKAVAQMLIQAYHRLTPEQQSFIRDTDYELKDEGLLGGFAGEWEKQILKQTALVKS